MATDATRQSQYPAFTVYIRGDGLRPKLHPIPCVELYFWVVHYVGNRVGLQMCPGRRRDETSQPKESEARSLKTVRHMLHAMLAWLWISIWNCMNSVLIFWCKKITLEQVFFFLYDFSIIMPFVTTESIILVWIGKKMLIFIYLFLHDDSVSKTYVMCHILVILL